MTNADRIRAAWASVDGLPPLVITGPRRRQWGFQTPDGWVEWRTFLGLDAPDGPSNVERNQ